MLRKPGTLPPLFMAWCLVKHWANLTFTFFNLHVFTYTMLVIFVMLTLLLPFVTSVPVCSIHPEDGKLY